MATKTTAGDIYALSMVILEVMSGLPPYHHLPTDHAVLFHVVRGGRPIRDDIDPLNVPQDLWHFLESLWDQNTTSRPTMQHIVQELVILQSGGPSSFVGAKVFSLSARNETELPKTAPVAQTHSSSSGEETSYGDLSPFPETNSRDLTGRVVRQDQYPFAGGGNSNIYRGKVLRANGHKIRVAIKMIRVSDDGSSQMEEILRRLKREVDVWSRLDHKNLLPFIGICDDIAPWPVLVSPFYKAGHIQKYLSKHPDANKRELVLGIAAGLEYLHLHDVVHGDIKVQNVLIDKRGNPCICDFGLSKIIGRRGFTTASLGTASYMAPELFFVLDALDPKQSPSTTKSSDVYSFGLLALEVLTSEPPKGRPSRPIVTAKVQAELHPKRSDYSRTAVTDEIWTILKRCWVPNPALRPPIKNLNGELASSHVGLSEGREWRERLQSNEEGGKDGNKGGKTNEREDQRGRRVRGQLRKCDSSTKTRWPGRARELNLEY